MLTFMMNLFMQRLVGGKEDYFRDALPMSEAKFKQLFLNIVIDVYLTGFEGLTIFAKDQSLADPIFLFFYMWLARSADKIAMPNIAIEDLLMGIKLEDTADPYVNTQIDAHRATALKCFLEHGADFADLPAIIVFPDKTCLINHP